MIRCAAGAVLALTLLCPPAASAQAPRIEAEVASGGGWFIDESAIGHQLVGAAARWRLTPRLSIGPEFTYWRGPGQDRDQTLTGNVSYDLRGRGVTPFVVAGAGLFRHTDDFFGQRFASTEGGFTLGGGVRIPLPQGWYLASEWRVGWEPHMRLHVAVGRRF